MKTTKIMATDSEIQLFLAMAAMGKNTDFRAEHVSAVEGTDFAYYKISHPVSVEIAEHAFGAIGRAPQSQQD